MTEPTLLVPMTPRETTALRHALHVALQRGGSVFDDEQRETLRRISTTACREADAYYGNRPEEDYYP